MLRPLLLAAFAIAGPFGFQEPKPEPAKNDLGLPAYTGPKKRAAVTALEVKVQGVATSAPTPSGTTTVVTLDLEQPTEFGTGLTEMLITSLVESDRFIVLERLSQDEVRREQEAQARPEPPKQLGAQILVRGAITELKLRRSGAGAEGQIGEQVNFSRSKVEATVGLDLRLIEVDTGRILDSVRAEGKATTTRQNFNLSKDELKFGTASFDSGPLGGAVRSAIRDAVKRICQKTEKIQWEGRVVEVVAEEGAVDQIYVNSGEGTGIKAGDEMTVERPGKVLTDPETEVVIGRTKGAAVGRIRITETKEGFSIGEIVSGTGFQRGDIVRLVGLKK